MATIIDASGTIMGRLASTVAKRLIQGESIVIVNSEKAVITGAREATLRDYKNKRARGTQRFGPYFPRLPHMIVKRAVRGMMPYQTPRGRDAFRRLRVELGVPPTYSKMPLVKVPGALRPVKNGMTIGALSKDLGAPDRAPHKTPAPAAKAAKGEKPVKAAKPKTEKKVKA